MRIVILGAGGVGGVLGARLASAGHHVGFVARGETLRALRTDGLHVSTPQGELVVPRPEASDAPAELGPADVVFLCTKLYDLGEAAAACRPIVRDETLVVPIQNGIEADEIVAARLGRGCVAAGLVYTTSTSEAPGCVRQSSEIFRFVFGLRGRSGGGDGGGAAARALEAACRSAGIDATLADDIAARLWAKLVFLGSVSAITCLGRLRIGRLRATPGTRALLVDAMREVIAVAAAEGVELAGDLIDRNLELLDSLPEDATSSMHADLMSGRRLEVEWLSGAVARKGRERGVPTPIHRTACECLLPHAAGAKLAPSVGTGGGAAATPAERRPLPVGYRLSLKQDDLQLDVVHEYLTRSYWSPGISRELVETAARNSLVAGVYDSGGRQVGYARVAGDRATFGYLADVFVLDAHRGRGLASAMVAALMDLPEVRGMRRLLLATRDAHEVYARLGWAQVTDATPFMQILRRPAATMPRP